MLCKKMILLICLLLPESVRAMSVIDGCELINFNEDCDALRHDYISMNFDYGLPEDQTTLTTSGTATVTSGDGLINAITSSAVGGSTLRIETIRAVPCKPHDESYAIFSARIVAGSNNPIGYIGLFDVTNGLMVSWDGVNGGFGVAYRNDGVTTFIPQASFNVDPLDGTGPSGFTIDTADLNSFRISFLWEAGTFVARYQIFNTDGTWITFHELIELNNQAVAAFSNPYLPMSIEEVVPQGSQPITISSGGWRAGVIHSGFDPDAGIRTFSANNTVTLGLLSGEEYSFTIRNKTTFVGSPNKILVHLQRVGGGSGIDLAPILIRYYKNATLVGAAFTDVNTANSVVEVDTSATSFSGGNLLWLAGSEAFTFTDITIDTMEFYLAPGESVTVTTEQFAGLLSVTAYAMITWDELQ